MQEKKITAVICANGGAGKSTVTVNLGAELAGRGLKTVLVDLNMGMRALDLYTGLENQVLYTAADLLDSKASPAEVMLPCPGADHLFLIPAPQTKQPGDFTEEQYAAFFESLRSCADQILADTPPGIGEDLRRILRYSDRAILICTSETASVRNADHLRRIAEEEGIKDCMLLVSRFPALAEGGRDRCEEIRELIPLTLLAVLPEEQNALPSEGIRRFAKDSCCRRQIESAARRLLGYEDAGAPVTLFDEIAAASAVKTEGQSAPEAGTEAREEKGSLLQRIKKRLEKG